MSAGRGAVRARYGFPDWKLSPVADEMPCYVGRCLTCGVVSTGAHGPDGARGTDADTAQTWCLKHAGRTGHADFELSATRPYRAAMTDPSGGARSPSP